MSVSEVGARDRAEESRTKRGSGHNEEGHTFEADSAGRMRVGFVGW